MQKTRKGTTFLPRRQEKSYFFVQKAFFIKKKQKVTKICKFYLYICKNCCTFVAEFQNAY